MPSKLEILHNEIVSCTRCVRLIEHCRNIAQVKRRAYRDQEYWGKPVPGFGDPRAPLFIVGLAPGAHGANRTGRMFTGDGSGDYLYRALWENGFASQPSSTSRNDGLVLSDCYIASSARCAPPDNKPTTEEILACRPYLVRELDLFPQVKIVVALGKLAFDNYLAVLKDAGRIRTRTAFVFAHNCEHVTGPAQPLLISSYHPSQQNTSTGKLTREMLSDVFARARAHLQAGPAAASPARRAAR